METETKIGDAPVADAAMYAPILPPKVDETTKPSGPVYDTLLAYVKKCFINAEQARRNLNSNVELRLRECKLRRSGFYTADQEAKIKAQNQQPYFLRHTTTKCNQAEAVLEEIETTVASRSWSIDPTPDPDVPIDLRQRAQARAQEYFQQAMAAGTIQPLSESDIRDLVDEVVDKEDSETMRLAKRRCGRAEKKIRDQLLITNFDDVYDDVRSDMVTCGIGILKGPVMRHVRRFTNDKSTGMPVVTDEAMPVAERVDPLDAYPEGSITEIEDGYFIEKYRCGRQSLFGLIGLPKEEGYIDSSIRSILVENKENTVYSTADMDRAKAEDKNWAESQRGQFDVFEFWGSISGTYLKPAGVEGVDDSGEYQYQVIWCANQIIKMVANPHPLGTKPYQVCRYKKRPGSFWGDGVPELMRDKQDFINAAGRSLAINAGLIAGPQVEIDKNRFVDGQSFTIVPLKRWMTKNAGALTVPGVRFTTIQSSVSDLMAIMGRFEQASDDATGVQPYTAGNVDGSDKSRTFSGMAQLTQLGMRGIKQTIRSLDKMKACFIKELYLWYVLHSEDEDFRGDAQVATRGTLGIMLSDLRMARLSDAINMAKDPNVLQIIGIGGLSRLIREYIELLLPDGSDIVPSDTDVLKEIEKHGRQIESMTAMREAQAMQGAGQQGKLTPGQLAQGQGASKPADTGMPPATEAGQQISAGVS